ncbi:uncharacterized protein BDW43DRAFT_276037 [Aspergillus alliaceus]|uniref:uncharacterized protein n=1 Tax=Petromyces alliaceus TaxID=209559 RepID=UPI0012A6DC5D|nr:uncharacterized protein BDW43DRAFT_276037 [Aspergillus alliaceus]KAB8233721.1 hypothetical protein BDW43DRAFT_276037 [Aspergillus alliaceus]
MSCRIVCRSKMRRELSRIGLRKLTIRFSFTSALPLLFLSFPKSKKSKFTSLGPLSTPSSSSRGCSVTGSIVLHEKELGAPPMVVSCWTLLPATLMMGNDLKRATNPRIALRCIPAFTSFTIKLFEPRPD